MRLNKTFVIIRTCLVFTLFGLLIWLLEAFNDYLFFNETEESLFSTVPHELFFRSLIVVVFSIIGLISGIISYRYIKLNTENHDKHQELMQIYEELSATEEELRLQNEELQEQRDQLEQSKNELENQKSFFEQTFLQSATSTQILSEEGWCMKINNKMTEVFGVLPEHIEGNVYNIFEDKEVEKTGSADKLRKVFNNHEIINWDIFFDIENAAASQNIEISENRKAWFRCKAYPILNADKSLAFVVLQHEDITDYKLKEALLFEEKERLKVTIRSIGDAVISTDINGRVEMMNKVAEKLTGWIQSEVTGLPLSDVFKIIDENTREPHENPIDIVLRQKNTVELSNYIELISRNGQETSIEVCAAPIIDLEGQACGVVLVFRDVTEKRRKEDRIKYLSFHDKLTGLYNRAYFEEELKRLDMTGQYPISIIIGDVNGLKLTNDVFGHLEGDRLLQKIAEIIKQVCSDKCLSSRWGGDEFAVILPGADNNTAYEICQRIRHACTETGNDPIRPSLAMGISTKNTPDKDIMLLLKEAEDRMYRHKLLESKSVRSSIIASLEKTLFERSFETEEHAHRMSETALRIGKAMGLSHSEQDELKLLSLLHDIGKIAIPDSILTKPGKLIPTEWDEMRKHPEIGYRIAQSTPELSHIADYILTHHERWDGNGYPQGLKANEIPKLSRILSLVDAYDVMTHSRPYKKAISREKALDEIRRCSGSQFDPEIVEVFLQLV